VGFLKNNVGTVCVGAAQICLDKDASDWVIRMDRSSNSVKIEKIRRALEAKDYDQALELAKTVDSARIRSAADLSVVAEAYEKKGIYDTALVYYEQIYLNSRTRRILIHLINLCLKLSMADMAETYLRDFCEMAPKDFYRYIFRYHIDKLRGEEIDVLIYDLEQLKSENFMEDWSYELAKLYHKNGQVQDCIRECNDIILWFGSGMYVDRARGLRALHLNSAAEEGGIAGEVRKLMDEGRSEKELEEFIEEATMPEGNTHYSEEEYNQERFGKPVYEEEGKDVIWNTKEFGAVTDEMIKQQNTMDLLQGMQVAEQIRMQAGAGHELSVQEPGEKEGTNWSEREEDHAAEFAPTNLDKWGQTAVTQEETAAEMAVRRLQKEKVAREQKLQEEKAAREKEIEEKLNRMLEQGKSEEELSRAIREMTNSEEEENIVRAAVQRAQETKRFNLPLNNFKQDEEKKEIPKKRESENGGDFQKEEKEPLYEYPAKLIADYAREAPLLDAHLKKHNMKAEEFFGSFLASTDLREQIFSCMERILEEKNHAINIILTGEEKSGKTTLAKALAKCIQMLGGISSPRVAVIRGDKLNHIDLEEKREQLKASTMIVEHTSGMSHKKAAQLLSMNEVFAGETAVILEDEHRKMNLFLRENEAFDHVYTNRIHLPEWSVEDWFVQALWILYSNEYMMTESVAEEFLYKIREELETHRENPHDAIENYTGRVLRKAEKRTAQILREFALAGNYKQEELMLLRSEDL